MDFTYLQQQPSRYTFEQPKLKAWVESWCKGRVLNLFAGKTKLNVDEYRVDSNKEMVADWYGDAYEFIVDDRHTWDTIILDPPYNLNQAREKYEGHYISSLTRIYNRLVYMIDIGGYIITLGYNTGGMGKKRGFKKVAVCIVNHGGHRNDTLCLVEEKYQGSLY